MRPPRIPRCILFVCLGNICRSPAAEIIFHHMAAADGRADEYFIDSAGIIGHHAGSPPDARMSAALRERNYPVFGNARKIGIADLGNFDLIVAMDETNFADIRGLDPAGIHHHKIHPFVSFCRRHSAPRVPDPYFGGQRGFDHVIDLLEDGCEGILLSPFPCQNRVATHKGQNSANDLGKGSIPGKFDSLKAKLQDEPPAGNLLRQQR